MCDETSALGDGIYQGLFNDAGLFFLVRVVRSFRRRCHGFASAVCRANVALAVDDTGRRHDTVLHEIPRTHVFRLFLGPHKFSIGVLIQLQGDLIERERAQLLDAHNRHVVQLHVAPLFQKLVVDLARAKNNTTHVLVAFQFLGEFLRKDALKRGAGTEFLQVGDGQLVAQQSFRRRNNQRLAGSGGVDVCDVDNT
jgi:hypothetical protein